MPTDPLPSLTNSAPIPGRLPTSITGGPSYALEIIDNSIYNFPGEFATSSQTQAPAQARLPLMLLLSLDPSLLQPLAHPRPCPVPSQAQRSRQDVWGSDGHEYQRHREGAGGNRPIGGTGSGSFRSVGRSTVVEDVLCELDCK
jgi:hypothetical protein